MASPRIAPTVYRRPDQEQPELPPDGGTVHRPWLGVTAIEPDDDALSRFPPEETATERLAPLGIPQPPKPQHRRWLALALVVFGILSVAAVPAWYLWGSALRLPIGASHSNGTLVVESRPAGAVVTVDGQTRGTTPVSMSLPPGRHTLMLAGGATNREMAVTIDAGARVVQYVEMPEAPPTGRLSVETSPPGAQVFVDGTPHGVTPLNLEGLAPGSHLVSLRNGTTALTQTVTLQAGAVVSLVVPFAQPDAASPGWMAVSSPIELQLFEGGRLIGTSSSDRILVLSGQHELQLVNTALGYETSRVVRVTPGAVATVQVEPPNGVLYVNAVPWAEVFVDGTKIGETPIANHPTALGSHEIVLRHPRYGEQRRTVIVSLTAPARVGVDLRK